MGLDWGFFCRRPDVLYMWVFSVLVVLMRPGDVVYSPRLGEREGVFKTFVDWCCTWRYGVSLRRRVDNPVGNQALSSLL